MNGPISYSYDILSAKSGIGKFSGSFFSIQVFQADSLLLIDSGRSLKNADDSWPKKCLDNAKIFSQALSYNHAKFGLDFSERISKAAPDFKKIDTSPELSF